MDELGTEVEKCSRKREEWFAELAALLELCCINRPVKSTWHLLQVADTVSRVEAAAGFIHICTHQWNQLLGDPRGENKCLHERELYLFKQGKELVFISKAFHVQGPAYPRGRLSTDDLPTTMCAPHTHTHLPIQFYQDAVLYSFGTNRIFAAWNGAFTAVALALCNNISVAVYRWKLPQQYRKKV